MTRVSQIAAVPVLLAAALSLTACDHAVRTGAAATVGDDRITTTQLDDQVRDGLKDPAAQQSVGTDKPTFQRSVLSRLITHQLIEVAAKQQGVTVDGGDIDTEQATLETSLGGAAALQSQVTKAGFTPATLRTALTDLALRDKLSDKLTASISVPEKTLQAAYQSAIATEDQVHSAHILVKTKALADSLLAQVRKDPSQFAALAAKYSTDTSTKNAGGDLGFQGRGQLAKPFEDAIFAAKPGTFVEAHTQFGYHVIHVLERHTTQFVDAIPALRRQLLTDQRTAALTALVSGIAKKQGVHVNPRFGAWNAAKLEVDAAAGDAVSSPSPDGAAPAPTDGTGTAP